MSKITLDGNAAASKIAYAFSEMAAIYPITPSSPMAEMADEMQSNGKINLFGAPVKILQMQSEAGVAGALHGMLIAGTLATTFTCSQGLLLMLPNMYKIAGELLPTVFHVSARTVATHALSIFGDHSDIMAVRSTGFAILGSTCVQEAQDMAVVAHIATLKSSVPFVHFFDGFRTSHEINKIEDTDYDTLKKLLPLKEIAAFKNRAMTSVAPTQHGTAQNPDIFFQNREAGNQYYNKVENIVKQTMKDFEKATGRSYKTIEYYGPADAQNIIVMMGSGAKTAIETVNYLNSQTPRQATPATPLSERGILGGDVRIAPPTTGPQSNPPMCNSDTKSNKMALTTKTLCKFPSKIEGCCGSSGVCDCLTGVIVVRLFRPFGVQSFINELPKSVKTITVLDRTKEQGADGEPLYKDICTALLESGLTHIKVLSGRYGLGGKEFTPAMVKAVIDNMNVDVGVAVPCDPSKGLAKTDATSQFPSVEGCKNKFSVGITDDITHTSLSVDSSFCLPNESYACKFYGLGSDGTVGANKNSIKIIGEQTDMNAQGYFEYDSKKSGSLTISHLRFGKLPVDAPYLINSADFAACHNLSYIGKYDMLGDLKQNGIFLLNSDYGKEELNKILPNKFIQELKQKNINFYTVNATEIAKKLGLGRRINTIMQACFFKLTDIIPYQKAEKILIDTAKKSYKNKGDKLVEANVNSIKHAIEGLEKINLDGLSCHCEPISNDGQTKQSSLYYTDFIRPIEQKKGDNIPSSAFDPTGTVPTNTSKFEKRGISIESPCWLKQNCIQCNMCSMVCPHAAIRPILIDQKTKQKAPQSFETIKALGVPDYEFRIQIDVANCTGCENCVHVCPAKQKALKMISSVDLDKQEKENIAFADTLPENPKTIFKDNTLKGSQFNKPLFEFSGACAGCGETPYIKLATQLFGKRMLIANATGCSSIYGGSAPTCPYSKNCLGHGPAWANSLFEDNAEFGLGIHLAKQQSRLALKKAVESRIASPTPQVDGVTALLTDWLANFDDGEKSYELAQKIVPLIENIPALNAYKNNFVKESTWIIGGDGWAYDIGYGGLDHVIASGENVNILVLDTEVYSNTGGQTSKSTPLGATAKFAENGKRTAKKDLGMMAMNYKNVYVAQVGMGADMNQLVKAMSEAEAYNGPSLIIAYSPCINHGMDMNLAQAEIKKAVETGYWHLYRYNPELKSQGKNPFTLDSPAPTRDYTEFLEGESRYTALNKKDPALAKKLFEESKLCAEERYKTYLRLSKQED